jgi:uncharacterized protein (TIGR00288 family)
VVVVEAAKPKAAAAATAAATTEPPAANLKISKGPTIRALTPLGFFFPENIPSKQTASAALVDHPPFCEHSTMPVDKQKRRDEGESIMAVFLDFENLALGTRDSHFPDFEITKVLDRLLIKGHIVVKKAYCDFDRYKKFKTGLHEAAFELIEIPHVRQSGKNSADIRMVVDALDLCYTKSHVDTFVIISGDSDFSPLVSKLRENDKTVIGVGVKDSTSDLFLNNCDEFIYYDDLVRTTPARSRQRVAQTSADKAARPTVAPGIKAPSPEKAYDLLADTLDDLFEERGENDEIWASMLKQAIKRRNPGFNEKAYGFRSFNDFLLAAEKRRVLSLRPDEKSGSYTARPID